MVICAHFMFFGGFGGGGGGKEGVWGRSWSLMHSIQGLQWEDWMVVDIQHKEFHRLLQQLHCTAQLPATGLL